MPARYHEGARKAHEIGRRPIYTDIESARFQKEKERMIREQVRRRTKPKPSRYPANWTKFERMAKAKRRKLINVGSVLRG